MEYSLYIHIPFCISKCKYCDFFSVGCEQVSDVYINALCNQIKFFQKKYDISAWSSIYIGGGTPSLLTGNQLKTIFDSINGCDDNKEIEITIEVNPDDITETFLSELNDTPVNRISCGIQSLNDESLSFVNRRANSKKNINAANLFKKFWKKQLSFDLISGLPKENKITFVNGLKKLISYNPDHFSMYSLTIEEETPLGKMIYNNEIDYNSDLSDELWLCGKKLLEENGFYQYEVSNFAKKGCESKHNLKYWTHKNYIGCGCTGTGTVYTANGEGFRFTNTKNIDEYIGFWSKSPSLLDLSDNIYKIAPMENEVVDVETSVFEFFMMGLRKTAGITDVEFMNCFNIPLPDNFITCFTKWKEKGFCEILCNNMETRYKFNEKGMLFLNKFLEELLSL